MTYIDINYVRKYLAQVSLILALLMFSLSCLGQKTTILDTCIFRNKRVYVEDKNVKNWLNIVPSFSLRTSDLDNGLRLAVSWQPTTIAQFFINRKKIKMTAEIERINTDIEREEWLADLVRTDREYRHSLTVLRAEQESYTMEYLLYQIDSAKHSKKLLSDEDFISRKIKLQAKKIQILSLTQLSESLEYDYSKKCGNRRFLQD